MKMFDTFPVAFYHVLSKGPKPDESLVVAVTVIPSLNKMACIHFQQETSGCIKMS